MTRGLRLPCITATTPNGFSCGAIGNQIFAYQNKAPRPRGKVRAAAADTGERDKSVYGSR
jgi:hypothetical protein